MYVYVLYYIIYIYYVILYYIYIITKITTTYLKKLQPLLPSQSHQPSLGHRLVAILLISQEDPTCATPLRSIFGGDQINWPFWKTFAKLWSKSPFDSWENSLVLWFKSQFLMRKPLFLGFKSQFFMGKLTISMERSTMLYHELSTGPWLQVRKLSGHYQRVRIRMMIIVSITLHHHPQDRHRVTIWVN